MATFLKKEKTREIATEKISSSIKPCSVVTLRPDLHQTVQAVRDEIRIRYLFHIPRISIIINTWAANVI